MARIRRMTLRILLILPVLSACAVHRPQTIESPVVPPDSFLSETHPAAALDSVSRWWVTFDDPVLDSLIERAFLHNLDLMRAHARLDQSRALARINTSVRFPQIDGSGRASRDQQTMINIEALNNTYSLSVSAGFELDLWRKLASRDRAGKLAALASLEDMNTLYLSLSTQVAELYYIVIEQRAQLVLTDRTIESYSDILSLVEERYQEGVAGAIDIYQARQNLSMARAARPVYENGLASAEHALSVLLSEYPRGGIAGELAVLPETPEAFPAGLPSELLERRPDIRAALLRVMASDAEIGAAVADRFPSINLLGSYGNARSVASGWDITSTVWNLMANLTLPLIDGGRRRAETDRTRAAFLEQLGAYQQTVLNAFQEVEDALVANRTTEERIRMTGEWVESTSSMLRLAVENYSQGLTDYLPLLTAQSLDYNTRSQLLSAHRQLISDRISLARAIGGDWMENESEKRVAASE